MKKVLSLVILISILLVGCGQIKNPYETEVETGNEITEESVKETETETETVAETETEAETIAETETEAEQEPKPEVNQDTMDLAVYFLKDDGMDMYLVRQVHEVAKTSAVATSAINELISGTVQDVNAFRPLPTNVKLLGIDINNGVAVVDFSKEIYDYPAGSSTEALAIQAIVNTLTEFPTIDKVEFLVEGEAVETLWGHVSIQDMDFTRQMGAVREPNIWVDTVEEGQLFTSDTRISGSMMQFENNLVYRLNDSNGNEIQNGFVTGQGFDEGRSYFDFQIDFEKPETIDGSLELFGISAKDGSEIDKVVIPVRFE